MRGGGRANYLRAPMTEKHGNIGTSGHNILKSYMIRILII